MVETNRRIDAKMIVNPPAYKQPWHNRASPRKMSGRHASGQSIKTSDHPKGGVRTGTFHNSTSHQYNLHSEHACALYCEILTKFDFFFFASGFEQEYGHATSKDTPYFIAASGQRAKVEGDLNPTDRTLRKKKTQQRDVNVRRMSNLKSSAVNRAAGASANNRASWDNRNVMGGCHGRVSLKEQSSYASTVAGI